MIGGLSVIRGSVGDLGSVCDQGAVCGHGVLSVIGDSVCDWVFCLRSGDSVCDRGWCLSSGGSVGDRGVLSVIRRLCLLSECNS